VAVEVSTLTEEDEDSLHRGSTDSSGFACTNKVLESASLSILWRLLRTANFCGW
jgi:hypothetical protein